MDEKKFKERLGKSLKDVQEKVDDVEVSAAVLEVANRISRSIGEPDEESERDVTLAMGKIRRVNAELQKEAKR